MKTVVGLYDDVDVARDVVDDLVDSGFSRNDISLVARDFEGTYGERLEKTTDVNDTAAEGAVAGMLGGGAIGGLAGLLIGMSAFVIPGIGPVVAAGPIAAALAGAGIGAATGGVLGALVGWGIPEAEAEYYAEGVRRGGTLVGVKVNEAHVNNVIDILNDHNPIDVEQRSEYWRESGWEGFDSDRDLYTRDQYTADRNRYGAYAGDGDYDTYAPAFRQHYQSTYAANGLPYNRYEPGYRYGYQLANDSRYNRYDTWNEIEPEAHREWRQMNRTSTNGDTWNDIKEAVRHAWNEVTNGNGSDYETRRTY